MATTAFPAQPTSGQTPWYDAIHTWMNGIENAITFIHSFDKGQIVSIDGDLWILANATWDGSEFYRQITGHASFGLCLQGTGTIPGEAELGFDVAGATLWVAQPEDYTLIRAGGEADGARYAATGGWELGFLISDERQFTLGGGGMEIDGYGIVPYSRIMSNATGTALSKRLAGVAKNAYTDFLGYDDTSRPSWFFGIVEDYDGTANNIVEYSEHFAVVRQPANTAPEDGVWPEFFRVNADGTTVMSYATVGGLSVKGIATSRPDSPVTGQECFDTDLGKPVWWNGSAWVDATGTAV